jgi:hypothetical protein
VDRSSERRSGSILTQDLPSQIHPEYIADALSGHHARHFLFIVVLDTLIDNMSLPRSRLSLGAEEYSTLELAGFGEEPTVGRREVMSSDV